MVRTKDQAATLAEAAAARGDTHKTGRCLEVVRDWFAIGPLFQDGWDHDGLNEATDAWVGAAHKHPGDRTPPRGVPVFFSGGGAGHVAITTGRGTQIVSSDWPKLSSTTGRIGLTTIEQIERSWGRTYVGWSEDLNGVLIPTDTLVSNPVASVPSLTIPLPTAAPAPLEADMVNLELKDTLRLLRRSTGQVVAYDTTSGAVRPVTSGAFDTLAGLGIRDQMWFKSANGQNLDAMDPAPFDELVQLLGGRL